MIRNGSRRSGSRRVNAHDVYAANEQRAGELYPRGEPQGEVLAAMAARVRACAQSQGGTTMSIFGSLMGKILGHSARASEAKVNEARASAPAAPAPAPTAAAAPAATAAPAPVSMATIEASLADMAAASKQKLDWRNSIVDLMKLVGIDSDITNRRALANELGYTGDLNDSATMNVWLHKEVMRRMAESGGQVPANLTD
jgi:hypothetical protein